MKKLRFLSCVLVLSVILSVVFSPSCYAVEDGFKLNFALSNRQVSMDSATLEKYFTSSTSLSSMNNVADGSTSQNSVDFSYSSYNYLSIAFLTNGLSIPANTDYSLSISNLYLYLKVFKASTGAGLENIQLVSSRVISQSMRIIYSDGSSEYIYTPFFNSTNSIVYSSNTGDLGISQIQFCINIDVTSVASKWGEDATYRIVYGGSSLGLKLNCEASQNEKGLLQSVVEWLKSIKDSIVNLPDLIIEKIKGLFIPSEEDMTAIKEQFDLLMKERFGALYEAGSIISDFVSAFTFQGEKRTIAFPMVDIFLAEDTFSFGGWDVNLVPYGFESIIGLLKGLIGIVCTLIFVVMLRNKFHKIVGDDS